MSSLKRIILINTHLPGVVELCLDGHTNICGTNASGKTTLQRLLPVFYGEYPSRVVPATRDSFERWYLPTESSFIIYEYQSMDDDLCQAVLSPSSEGRGVNYRFIHKAFELCDYQRDNLACLTMSELGRLMKRSGIHHTRLLNTREYRAIIQNDRGLLSSSNQRSELRGYTHLFSLCTAESSLRHIEKLAKAVHSKEGKMETIKSMIAAILEEEGVTPPASSLNPKTVEDWIRESKLILGFEAMRSEFDQLQQEYQQLLSSEQLLGSLFQGYERDKSIQWQRQEESKDTLEQLNFKRKQLEADWDEQHNGINLDLSATKGDINKSEDELDQIESQYHTYQNANIEQIKASLERLPGWRNDLSDLNERHKLMTEKHQDIEATYQLRLNTITQQLNLTLQELHQKQDRYQEELDNKQEQQNGELIQLEQQYNEQRQTSIEHFNTQQNELIFQQKDLQVHIDSVNYTREEQQALLLFDKRIENASEEKDHTHNKIKRLQQQDDHLRKQCDAADKNLRLTSQQVTACQNQLETLKQLLYPGHHTLLEFLRKEHPGWETSLGKVIHPELLQRSDLNPGISTLETNSLYGLMLDLKAINLAEYAHSEQQLEQQLKQAEDKLHESIRLQKDAQEQLRNIHTAREELGRNITLARADHDKHNNNIKRLFNEKKTRQSEIDSALFERKDKAKKQLRQLDHRLQKQAGEHKSLLDEQQQHAQEARIEKIAHWQEVTGSLKSQIVQCKVNLKERKSKAETERVACESWYRNELKSRGVDEDEIISLKRQRQDLDKKISETEHRRDDVRDYEHWYQQTWIVRKPKLQQQLLQDKALEKKLELQLRDAEKCYKAERTIILEKEQKARQILTETQQYLDRITALLKKLRELQLHKKELHKVELQNHGPFRSDADIMGNIDERLRQGDELLITRDHSIASVKAYVDDFDQLIAKQSGSSLAETWERSREECTSINDKSLHILDYRKLVSHLEQLLTIMVPQSLTALREQGRIFGVDLNAYYDVLADIDRRITSQSSRITKEVDEELFLDGVSNSEVRIRSRISELDFWPELQNFVKAFQQWQEEGFSTLPNEDYTSSMRSAIDIIGRSALSGGIASLLEIELCLREGNNNLVIRTDRQLNESSSHGMAYLILCKFLLAFTRLLRDQSNVTVHWPIDELGTLHHDNIKKIFDACGNNNIQILGAFPNPDSEVLSLFSNRYIINKQSKQLQIVKPRLDLIAEKLRQRKSVSQEVK